MAVKIQFRRDTAANWQSVNPILSQGELGLDTTNNRFKMGDGSTAWNDLDYTVDFEPDGTYPDLRAQATTKEDVDLGNVTNDAQVKRSEMGQPNGVATLDGSGFIPSNQLPSYVDDVLEVANFASLPATGETGKIYIVQDTGVIYRWSGSTYIEISNPLDLATTAEAQAGTDTTKAMTPARTKEAILQFAPEQDLSTYDNHIADTTIHFTKASLTSTDVGLGNVTNDSQVKRSEMGQPNGVATLDGSGFIPSGQLPSYVDDVLEFADTSFFPSENQETGKIYVALDTNKTYRWSGSTYVEISASLVPNDGTLTVQTGTALTGSGTFTADQNTSTTITINADIADQTEAETGTATDKLMTPERTSQAIKAISIDGGPWVTPIVDITDVTFESVTFTIQNLEDYEVDVKYELNTPPTANSITLAANTTSNELTISGLDAETNYILYAQSFLGNDAISEIISNSFTTLPVPDDPFGAPGEQYFVASTTSTNPITSEEETAGFFGLVDQTTFGTTMTQVMTDLGITQGTAQNTGDSLLKFLHRGKIKYINLKSIRENIS